MQIYLQFPNFNLRTLNQFISCLANTGLQLISSYWGHEVIIQSTSIANSCYDENLCDFGIRNQKSWILIMQRSQKPICFTVGKYAPLSLNTFLKVSHILLKLSIVLTFAIKTKRKKNIVLKRYL